MKMIKFNNDGTVNADESRAEIFNQLRQGIISDISSFAFELMFLDNLNQKFDFYGVDGNAFKLGIKDKHFVFEVIEDPDDGGHSGRSYLGSINVSLVNNFLFFPKPITKIELQFCSGQSYDQNYEVYGHVEKGFSGFKFLDLGSKKPILTVGTDAYDTYYSCFVFSYDPSVLQNETKVCTT